MQSQSNGDGDHRRFISTKTPGVYKRGNRYVAVVRVGGQQRKLPAASYAEAKRIKAEYDAKRRDEREDAFRPTRETFREYATEWVERYPGIRESTRDNYRGDLKRAYGFFGDRRLASITGRDLARYVACLMDERSQGRALSDATIANIVKPVRACLRSAKAEHQIREDPSRDLVMPRRDRIDEGDGDGEARAFTREQLAAVIGTVHPRYRLLFELLAATGLRISEALGLYWRHLDLDSPRPVVKVRQQFYRGRFQPPKSRKGRREVPLPSSLAAKLRQKRREPEWTGPDDLVFPNSEGRPLHVENVRRRHLRPVTGEAGASWAGFHTFRHTFASMKFEAGAPVTEVQRLLGHSTPRVTLDTYLHWLEADEIEPLDLDRELHGGNKVGTRPDQADEGGDVYIDAVVPDEAVFSGQGQAG